jgi:hypothetical protein
VTPQNLLSALGELLLRLLFLLSLQGPRYLVELKAFRVGAPDAVRVNVLEQFWRRDWEAFHLLQTRVNLFPL